MHIFSSFRYCVVNGLHLRRYLPVYLYTMKSLIKYCYRFLWYSWRQRSLTSFTKPVFPAVLFSKYKASRYDNGSLPLVLTLLPSNLVLRRKSQPSGICIRELSLLNTPRNYNDDLYIFIALDKKRILKLTYVHMTKCKSFLFCIILFVLCVLSFL